jgi:hypothetical protein
LQFEQNIGARCKFLGIIKELNYFSIRKAGRLGASVPWTDGRWSTVDFVVHGGLHAAAAKGLIGARPHGRFWAQKLVMAASNRSGKWRSSPGSPTAGSMARGGWQ